PARAVGFARGALGAGRGAGNRSLGALALETGIARGVDDPLRPAIAADKDKSIVEEGGVVGVAGRVEEMDTRHVALAAPGRLQAARAADVHRLAGEAAPPEHAEQVIQPGAVAADDDQVGRVEVGPEPVDLDIAAGLQVLALPGYDEETVGPAEGSDRPGPLAHRVGPVALRSLDQVDQQIFRAPALRIDA